MTVAVPPRAEIHQTIDQLRPEQLAQLWEFVELLTKRSDEAPLYRIHEQAVSIGVRDMADQHDHCRTNSPTFDSARIGLEQSTESVPIN